MIDLSVGKKVKVHNKLNPEKLEAIVLLHSNHALLLEFEDTVGVRTPEGGLAISPVLALLVTDDSTGVGEDMYNAEWTIEPSE